MIINNLNGLGPAVGPLEADAVLVVDPDTVLSEPVASQFLKPICRQYPEVAHHVRLLELVQLATGDRPKSHGTHFPRGFGRTAVEDIPRSLVGERLDHSPEYNG